MQSPLKIILFTFFSLLIFVALVKYAVPAMLDRIEDQRRAERIYNCAHYGAAMNKHYGRKVCPDAPFNQNEEHYG